MKLLFLLIVVICSINANADIYYAQVLCAQSGAGSTKSINERIKEFMSRPLQKGQAVSISAPGLSSWNSENRICVTSSVHFGAQSSFTQQSSSAVLCAADHMDSEKNLNLQIANTITRYGRLIAVSQPGLSNWNSENRICITVTY